MIVVSPQDLQVIDEQIRILRVQGLSVRKVSMQLQLPEKFVRKRILELGLPNLKKGGGLCPEKTKEKYLLFCQIAGEGKTVKEIAYEFEVSVVTVRKGLTRLGVKTSDQRKAAVDREKRNVLWNEYKGNPSMANRNKLVDANLKLVYRVAHSFSNHSEYDELVQEGAIGLVKAIEGFDPSFGYQFSSYAIPFIKGEILHYWRDRSRLIKTRIERVNCLSLDCTLNRSDLDGSPIQLLDTIPAPEKSTTEIMDLNLAIESLDEKYQRVVDLYYFQMMKRNTIARLIGVSPTTVTRYINESISCLRRALN